MILAEFVFLFLDDAIGAAVTHRSGDRHDAAQLRRLMILPSASTASSNFASASGESCIAFADAKSSLRPRFATLKKLYQGAMMARACCSLRFCAEAPEVPLSTMQRVH